MAPNAWAVVCLWRRFFQLKDEEQEKHLESIARALEQEIDEREDCPIACDDVVRVRKDYIREYYRQVVAVEAAFPRSVSKDSPPSLTAFTAAAQEAQNARLQLNQPNLSIPMSGGSGSLYLAQ